MNLFSEGNRNSPLEVLPTFKLQIQISGLDGCPNLVIYEG